MKKLLLNCVFGLLVLSATVVNADKAVFAGGCFWCMESDFEKLDGVSEVISGFTGGSIENPTYNGDHTGHYEAVEITYDPQVVDYQGLLDHFWVNVDPFDDKGQFCDKGHSYLSAIFVANETERELADASRQKVVDQFPQQNVITPILEATTFWPIAGKEQGHQDYYKKNPTRYKTYRFLCGRDKRLKQIWGS